MNVRRLQKAVAGIALLLIVALAGQAMALRMESVGPARPELSPSQPGWPHGLAKVLGHPSRVYSQDTNGSQSVYFQCDADKIQEIVQQFAKMRVRDHRVQLQSGTPKVESFDGREFPYNIRLQVTGGLTLGMYRLKGDNASTFEPMLTIFANEETTATIKTLKWPAHLIIKNEVEDLALDHDPQHTVPDRQLWHAAANFENGKPAVDFEASVQTKVTLWEKDNPLGIELGQITHEGKFSAPFSKAETARLDEGQLWMTMTVGNWATKAQPDHQRFEFDNFKLDAGQTKPVVALKPQLYYGRILFEDDSPAIFDPEPWPSASVQVSFPYAGQVRPDKNGDFKVMLTKEQLKNLRARRKDKNIYVPLYHTKGQSRALHVFDAALLTTDKEKPGVVKIPKPIPLNPDF